MKKLYIAFVFVIGTLTGFSQSWTGLAGPFGGRVTDIQNDGANLFALVPDQNAIYKSTNGSASWTVITPATLPVVAMWVEANKIYAIESTNSITYYLNETTDGGATWQRKNTTANVFKGKNLLKTAKGELISWYDYENIYISSDNGVTWTPFYARTGLERIISVVANSSGDIFVSSDLGVFRHLYSTSSFTKVYDPLATAVYNLKLGIDASNNLYLMESSYTAPSSYYNKLQGSVNKGDTWTDIIGTGLSSPSFNVGQWFISPVGVYLGYGYPLTIYKSSGSNWTPFGTSPGAAYTNSSVNTLKFISASEVLAGTNQDGIFKSTDTGASWNLASNGIAALDGLEVKINSAGKIFYLTANSNGYYWSSDQGVNWSFKQIEAPNNVIKGIIKSGTNSLLTWSYANLYRSNDDGGIWNLVSFSGISSASFTGMIAGGANELFATSGSSVYRSTDLGTTWTDLNVTGLASGNYSFDNFNKAQSIALDGAGNLHLSLKNNDNNKWELYRVPSTGGPATKLSVEVGANVTPHSFFADGNKIYWADNSYIHSSTDNGTTWKTLSFPNEKLMPVTSGIGASRLGGYFVSGNGGLTWNGFSLPASGSFIRSVATNASNVSFAATSFSSALKLASSLLVDPGPSSPYVNFSWTPLGGPYGGSISKVFKGNSGKIFSLAAGNLYSTSAMNVPWARVVDPNFQYSPSDIIVVSSGDITNGDFLAFAGGYLWRSTDEGQHWTKVASSPSPPFTSYGGYLRLTSSGILWANDGNNVRRSFNQGLNWSTVYSNPNHTGYNNTLAAESNTIFIVESNTGIKRSIDSGDNWSVVNTGLANPTTTTYNVMMDASGSAIAWSLTNVYKFNNGNSTWESVKGDFSGNSINSVFSKTGQEYYMFVNGSELYRTQNGGTNWAKVNNSSIANSMIFDSGEIYAGTYDGFSHSADNGTTLTQWNDGINELYPNSIRVIGPRLFLTASNNFSFVSLDKGTTWNKLTPSLSKIFPMPDGSYLATGNSSSLYKSSDGVTWSVFSTDNFFIQDISTADGNTLYGTSYNLVYSKTSATQWAQLAVTGLPASYSSVRVAAGPANKLYVTLYNQSSSKQEMYEIVAGVATKLNLFTNPSSTLFRNGKTYVFEGDGRLSYTADGTAWTSLSSPAGNNFIISHLDYFFIIGLNGALWLSRDLGVTWQNVGESNMTQQFTDVFLNPNDGVVYGAVNGNYQRKSVIILPQELTPPTFTQLSPVNGTVDLIPNSISLQITFSEIVNPIATKKIKIYDAANPGVPLGTMDATLAMQSGNTFTFNPSSFTPAVNFSFSKSYFISIDAGAFVDVNITPNAFAGITDPNVWRFSTMIDDGQAPVISTLSPADDATGVAYAATLQITFDENIYASSGKTIKLYDASSPASPVQSFNTAAGVITGGKTVTFTPSSSLGNGKSYYVLIDAGAYTDLFGNPSAAITLNTAWNFTALYVDVTAPVVSTLAPANNATGVSFTPTLQLIFSEDIQTVTGKTLRIYDSTVPSTPFETIDAAAGVISNGKTLTYTPTNALSGSKTYYVQIDAGAVKDLAGNQYGGMPNSTLWKFNTIVVDTQAPVIAQLAPVNNAVDVAFSSTLQLTFNEDVQTVTGKTIRIYDSSVPATPIETMDALTGVISTGKTVTYTPSTVLGGSKTYYVLVDAGAITDLAGNAFAGITGNTTWKFNTLLLDTQPPSLVLLAPTNNQTNVVIGTTLSLTFDENIKATAGKTIKLFDSADPSTPEETIDASAGTVNAKSITFTLTKPLTGSKTYYVLLDNGAITDIAGNAYSGISANTTWKFSTDAIAPSVTQLTPANNSTDISFTTPLELHFDEDILAATGKTIDLYLAGSVNPVASVNASTAVISGKIATFTLANALVGSGVYHVLVANGAFTDMSGNPFVGISSSTDWTFTTHDVTPPVVALLEPANNATEVSLTSPLKITFDESITKVAGKKLTLYDASQPATPLKTLDISTSALTGKTLSFDPGNIFTYNKSYYVLLESGSVTDANTNPFAGITTATQWQFSVETDIEKPSIVFKDGVNLTKGSGSYLIAPTISDNKKITSAKVFYRGISAESSVAFTSSPLDLNPTSKNYEFSVPETSFDKYGLEFYMEAVDAAGNIQRSPASENTYYYSYLTYSAASAPQLSALSFGGTLASYRIISVPFKLTDNRVVTILGELGSVNKSKWRLLTYSSDTKWNDYPTDFTTIDRGVGYWINIKDVTEIFIEGASTEGNNKNTLFNMKFNPGWNQIGNPYPVAISWNTIKAAIPAATSLGVLKVYKDGFQNGDIIKPMEGGFVFNSGAAVTISIPLPASSGGRQGNFVETRLDNPDWMLDINMKQGDVKYELAGVGMNPKAKLEFDSFDDLNPPHFSEFGEIQFSHPQERIKTFSRDVVPTQDSFTWEFTVDSNLPGKSELYWDNTAFGDNNKQLYLYDLTLQKPIDMREVNRYAFDPLTSTRFKIFFGSDLKTDIKPEQIALGVAYPNPAQNQTVIPFTLAENGSTYDVSLEIFDSMGKKIGTLVQGTLASGFYNATWDISAGQIAQGIYHVRLETRSKERTETRSGRIAVER